MKHLLASISLLTSFLASSQSEVFNTITTDTQAPVHRIDSIKPYEPMSPVTIDNPTKTVRYTSPCFLRYAIGNLGLYDLFPMDYGKVADWNNGQFSGMFNSRNMPGMMVAHNGGFAITQTYGDMSFTGYVEGIKYGSIAGIRTSFGFGGSATYYVTDRLSITAFGSYYTNPGNMPLAMVGYVSIPTFGGYLDYDISGPWGIRLGAQSYHSMTSNHWEVQPIAMPYFRISSHNVIGIDVGGILYQILQSRVKQHGPFNPTIRPPMH